MASSETAPGTLDLEAWLAKPKIDMHCHTWNLGDEEAEVRSSERLIRAGEMLGITEYWCSSPITGGRIASAKEVRGLCFVIPGQPGALDEVGRCLGAGMIGIKLYNQLRVDDPAVLPVLEAAAERGVPVLEHAGYLPAAEHLELQPNISHGGHFAAASRACPERTRPSIEAS